jgi:hypothetical protein
MRAINPNLSVPPEASQIVGLRGGGSFARFASRTPFSDSEERMLASQLLEVANEAELEQVLRDLSTKARRGVEPVRPTSAGPVEGLLKTVSKKALPSLATAAGASAGRLEPDAAAGKLGSLLDQALSAKVAGMSVADPDLKKCRQLFERYRQFVRLAGKATKAAASAPPGVAPVAVAYKILSDAARKVLTRTPTSAAPVVSLAESRPATPGGMKPTRETKGFTRSAPAATAASPAARATPFLAADGAPTKAPAPGPAFRTRTSTGRETSARRVCTLCELPPGSCQCRKIGRTGRWFRDGTSIVVNC